MQLLEVHSASLIDLLRDATIVDSSNGLLCVRLSCSSHPILLWNPAMRRVRVVAKAANCFEDKYYKLGFGFCSIVNDYKILRISASNAQDWQGEVYSVKTGLWKKVECGTFDGVSIWCSSIVANGNIFWFGFKPNGESRVHLLVSYNLALEVFTLIPSPISFLKPIDLLLSRLTVYENKLAILSHYTIDFESSLIDLWVMEEETGTSDERWDWTKKYSISHPCWLVPRTIWRNNLVCYLDIVAFRRISANDGKNVVLVNLTTNEFKIVVIHKCGIGYPVLNYVESLVPVENDYTEEL
ncbi:putative F-box protein At3g17480 [Neltuma alba]|uniref:putative F-box protein At3g17480 n=1 Tax=Neltuma alba TaxID=207710 RepID=UPI0010A50293|nr:putative F-box protein At3g17480 [Prosopis alba]